MHPLSIMLLQPLLVAAVGMPTATANSTEACPLEALSLVQTSKAASVLLYGEELGGEGPGNLLIRPSAGKKEETIAIGVMCKAFYGLDLKAGTSTMDLVTSMSWTDKRVVSFIPEGTASLTLSERQAQRTMWLPDLTISNRDIGGVDTISSTVTLDTQGLVQKVDRMIATVRSTFDDRSFPWDSQELVVLAASATHMKDDLVFEVAQEFSGVDSSVFVGKDFSLVNTTMTVFTQSSGAIEKSRARFGMKLRRVSRAYVPLLIAPAVIVVILGNSVFFLPLMAPFVVPRVASSIISILAVLSHRESSISMTPMGAGLSWLSVFDECILLLVCMCCLLNVFVEGVNYTQQNPELAVKMNSELQLLMPTLTILSMLVCFTFRDPESIDTLAGITRTVLIVGLGLYTAFCVNRARKSQREPTGQ